jgi:hypothetical protein
MIGTIYTICMMKRNYTDRQDETDGQDIKKIILPIRFILPIRVTFCRIQRGQDAIATKTPKYKALMIILIFNM